MHFLEVESGDARLDAALSHASRQFPGDLQMRLNTGWTQVWLLELRRSERLWARTVKGGQQTTRHQNASCARASEADGVDVIRTPRDGPKVGASL